MKPKAKSQKTAEGIGSFISGMFGGKDPQQLMKTAMEKADQYDPELLSEKVAEKLYARFSQDQQVAAIKEKTGFSDDQLDSLLDALSDRRAKKRNAKKQEAEPEQKVE